MGISRGILLGLLAIAPTIALASREDVRFVGPPLYPESLAYRPSTDQFYVGSARMGAIYIINREDKRYATAKPFIDDPEAPEVTGLAVDEERSRLLACVSDGGFSLKSSAKTLNRLAALAVYDLESGKRLAWHELSKLHAGDHSCSDIAVAKDGTAYVTDGASPVIYKIPMEGAASLHLLNEKFREEGGTGLSSIAHRDGSLFVTMHKQGTLWRVPLDKGAEPEQVKMPRPLPGADSLRFCRNGNLIVVQNAGRNVVHRLVSADQWKTATIRKTSGRIRHHPTEAALAGERVYAVESQMDALFDNKPATGDTKFTIKHLGYLK